MLKFIFITSLAFAHKGMVHKKSNQTTEAKSLTKISKLYLSSVKPIFQKSCFDCHSSPTKYPWYYKIPGAKQFIDLDIKEAHEHMDMGKDFPFASHASPLEDLRAIKASISNGSMPPLRYRILHTNVSLSEEEKKIILNWVDRGILFLEK